MAEQFLHIAPLTLELFHNTDNGSALIKTQYYHLWLQRLRGLILIKIWEIIVLMLGYTSGAAVYSTAS
jgi:hypothetical protein